MIRLGAVGDVVRTLPAVSALRAHYSDAHLTWMVERKAASVVETQPWVDEVMLFPREALSDLVRRGRWLAAAGEAGRWIAALRRGGFDLVLDFHGILKSGLLARLSGAPLRVGYAAPVAREGSWLFTNRRVRLGDTRLSRFERNEALVRFLAVTESAAQAPLCVPEAARERVRASLGAGPAPVVLHPGTSDSTPYKRWDPEQYGALAKLLAGADGVSCIVSFGPGERELARSVVDAAGGAARLAPETPSLPDLAALFAWCRLFVGSDSGPLHVASLVGTPVVQILGPTDPVVNAPYPGTPSRAVRVPVPCSPCRRGCAEATCMRGVPTRDVVSAARELLVGGPVRSAGTAGTAAIAV
ncbi:MAG: glycosyltransferase family 9 protein [Proteobacteria bacterium]|nr:glycosyltransferase family 9 protein [Pseudomonadota bacterium]